MTTTKDKVHKDIKDTRHKIELQLESALKDLMEEIGEKKFKRRIKKVSKILAKGTPKKKTKKVISAKKSHAKVGATEPKVKENTLA